MDYYEMLKQSYIEDDMSEDALVEDAILSLEQQLSYMNADDLIHRSRPLAIAYLALKEISKNSKVHYGNWVWDTPIQPHCSRCGWEAQWVHGYGYMVAKYCPNCGAAMDRNSLSYSADEEKE